MFAFLLTCLLCGVTADSCEAGDHACLASQDDVSSPGQNLMQADVRAHEEPSPLKALDRAYYKKQMKSSKCPFERGSVISFFPLEDKCKPGTWCYQVPAKYAKQCMLGMEAPKLKSPFTFMTAQAHNPDKKDPQPYFTESASCGDHGYLYVEMGDPFYKSDCAQLWLCPSSKLQTPDAIMEDIFINWNIAIASGNKLKYSETIMKPWRETMILGMMKDLYNVGSYDSWIPAADRQVCGDLDDPEKCSGPRCEGYRGFQNKTRNGKTCQAWTAQDPQKHDRTPSRYPEAGLEDNYCRNPDHESTIWCYTTDKAERWTWCDPITEV